MQDLSIQVALSVLLVSIPTIQVSIFLSTGGGKKSEANLGSELPSSLTAFHCQWMEIPILSYTQHLIPFMPYH